MASSTDDIKLGTDLTLEMAAGEAHSYRLELPAGHFVRIVVDQQGVDVAVALLDPDGKRVLEVDSPIGREGPETLNAVSEGAAEDGAEPDVRVYRVDVRHAEDGAPNGEYRLTVPELRPATQTDIDLAAAERDLSNAEGLRRTELDSEGRRQLSKTYEQLLNRFQVLAHPQREGDILLRIAWIAKSFDNIVDYIRCLEQAAQRYRNVSHQVGEGGVLNELGGFRIQNGEIEAGGADVRRALEVFRELGKREGIVQALNNIALMHRLHGETEKALETYEEALKFENVSGATIILYNLGRLLIQQGELDSAAERVHMALENWTRVGDQYRIVAHIRLGQIYNRQRRLDVAREHLEKALASREEASKSWVGSVFNSLGINHFLSDEYPQALESYEKAQAIFRETGDRAGLAASSVNLGQLHLAATDQGMWSNPTRALEYFEEASNHFGSASDRQIEASFLYGAAKALHDLGDFKKARARLEESLEQVEEMRIQTSSEGLRISYFATKQDYYELYIDVLMHLNEKEKAFEVAERRRARTLLDSLGEAAANIREGVDPELLAEERDTQATLNRLERRQSEVMGRRRVNAEVVSALDEALRQGRFRLDQIRRRIRTSSPRYAALTQDEPVSLEEIRKILLQRKKNLILSYSLGKERSFLWLVSEHGIESHVLPPRSEIEDTTRTAYHWLQELRLDAEVERETHLSELSKLILGPVAGSLGDMRLLIVGDGELLSFPFAVLKKTDPSGRRKTRDLIEDHEIAYLPSASLIVALRRELRGRYPAGKQIAILADAVFTPEDAASEMRRPEENDLWRSAESSGFERLPRLHHTESEAKAIEALAEGEVMVALRHDASKQMIVDGELDDYQILHFATHGFLNREHPELSGLVFSRFQENGLPQDGFLRLHEIYNLHLPAELVVLSACGTGLGREIRGEGLLSLTRGFMYAGAPRVLVSQWAVNDEATADLMRRFYWSLFEVGAPPALALRAAQLSMREESREWSHPFYWAPFVLQGDWRLQSDDDSDIEQAKYGAVVDPEPEVDLPGPDEQYCEELPEEWMRKICRKIRELSQTHRKKDEVVYNGVDAQTGEYLQSPMTEQELAHGVVHQRRDWAEERDTKWSYEQFRNRGPDRRPHPSVNPKDLASSGWGVIFPDNIDPEIKEALQPLLKHRKAQAQQKEKSYYRELEYKPYEDKARFFSRLDVEAGPADPRQLPYYLMIVGSPTEIPHRFQYLLDMQYAVGRLHFDRPEDYEQYANSVVAAETGEASVRRELNFFAVENGQDPAMRRTADRLVEPLKTSLKQDYEDWSIRRVDDTSQRGFREFLRGQEPPAFLFTSAHGLAYPSGHAEQAMYQGALICSDWEGAGNGPVQREHFFAAENVDDEAHVHGMIAFLFGCYSAGTPSKDNFPPKLQDAMRNRSHNRLRAPEAMLSALPKRLLSHPNGGALAVLGHVDRTWTRSFGTGGLFGHLHVDALFRNLLMGFPVGSAMDWIHERFAEISTEVTEQLDEYREPLVPGTQPVTPSRGRMAKLWRANNDARNFVVLGDPAVRSPISPRS